MSSKKTSSLRLRPLCLHITLQNSNCPAKLTDKTSFDNCASRHWLDCTLVGLNQFPLTWLTGSTLVSTQITLVNFIYHDRDILCGLYLDICNSLLLIECCNYLLFCLIFPLRFECHFFFSFNWFATALKNRLWLN
jgi:hypothetical protein